MNYTENFPFILFLLLEEKLPTIFYQLQDDLRQKEFNLIPVTIDQIQMLKSSSFQSKILILCSSQSINEFQLYSKKIKPHLRMLLKSESTLFVKLSSFQALNDEKKFYQLKNYIFLSYPHKMNELVETISEIFKRKLQLRDARSAIKKEGIIP